MRQRAVAMLACAVLLVGVVPSAPGEPAKPPGKPEPLKPNSPVRRAFVARDKDGDGTLSESEFVLAAPEADRPLVKRDFHLLDFDRDGTMSLDEFRNVPYLVPPEERGWLPDPVAAIVEKHFKESQAAWEQADRDGDGNLTLDEFRAATAELLPPPVVPFRVWAASYRLLDRDGDGLASRDEWRWFLEVWYGVRRPQGELLRTPSGILANWMHFKFLDRNHDDRVDHDEFIKWGFDGDQAEKRFELTDKNHDNVITFPEWADTNLWQIDLFWQFRGLDTNLDGRVDREELVKNIAEWQRKVAERMFPGFDTDRDGFLSLEEFALTPLFNQFDFWHDLREDRDGDGRLVFTDFERDQGPSLLGLAVEYFRRLDTDQDGALDHNEWSFHTPEPPKSRLFVTNADGKEVELLADVGLFDAVFHGSPEWSHNGKTIAFDSTPPAGVRCDFGRTVISAVAMSGPGKGKVEKLGYGNCPDWSPDDRQIAFFLNPGNPDGDQSGIWIMNADGTERRHIAPNLWYPRWSPDGHSLLCCSSSSLPKTWFLVDVETGRRKQVLKKAAVLGLPVWDPGGNLVCATLHLANRRALCLVDLAGDADSIIELWKGELLTEQQLRGYSDNSRPNWSADGLEVIFTDNTSGKSAIKRVATSGDQEPVAVSAILTHDDVHAVWSPDRKRIAITSTQPPAEIPGLKTPQKE